MEKYFIVDDENTVIGEVYEFALECNTIEEVLIDAGYRLLKENELNQEGEEEE